MGKLKVQVLPDRTGIFFFFFFFGGGGGWSANLSNFLGLGVEAGASSMYPQKMRVPPPPGGDRSFSFRPFVRPPVRPPIFLCSIDNCRHADLLFNHEP